jgi:hypothetical protein
MSPVPKSMSSAGFKSFDTPASRGQARCLSAIAMEMLRSARRYGSGENGRRATGPLPDMMEGSMAKVLVLFYSSYGHIEKLAHEIAADARDAGASADGVCHPASTPC